MMKHIFLVIILLLSHKVIQVAGASLYAAIVSPLQFKKTNSVFRFFLIRPVKLLGVVKLGSWAVSSSGLLIGYWVYSTIWGTPNSPQAFWVILCVATYVVIEISHYLLTFDLIDFGKATQIASVVMPKTVSQADEIPKIRTRVALQGFVAFYLTQFFRMLIGIGFIFFSIGRLGLVEVVGQPPSLLSSVGMALAMIEITPRGSPVYSGASWEIIRGVCAFLVFYWIVMFVSLAASTIEPMDFYSGSPMPRAKGEDHSAAQAEPDAASE